MSFCTTTSSGPAGQIFMSVGRATTKLDPCLSVGNVNFSKKMNFDALSESQKWPFFARECQSRHVILYDDFLRAYRTNFHVCGSRDNQTRPLSERRKWKFLKKKEFRRIVRISKMTFFCPRMSIATCHSVRRLPPDLPDKFSCLWVARQPDSTPVRA